MEFHGAWALPRSYSDDPQWHHSARGSVMSRRSIVLFLAVIVAVGFGFAGGWFARGSGSSGSISGRLLAVGGPSPGSPRPLRGEIVVTDASGASVATVEVPSDGSFSVVVPAGNYTVEGRSKYYNGGRTACFARKPVVIADGTSVETDVFCQEK